MSDIRFNNWLHQSGTGGVYQDGSGNVGIGTSVPSATLDVEGTINANTAVISGNLIVEGVLTYDDVTNIDSVGVVTAREGVKVPDSEKIFLGTSDDLQIYHNTVASYIDNTTAVSLAIRQLSDDADIVLQSDDGSGGVATYIRCDGSEGEVRLFHYGSEKLNTKSDGVTVTGELQANTLDINGAADISSDLTLHGNLDLQDNDEIRVGTGDDLKIYHNGSHNYIQGSDGQNIYIDAGDSLIIRNSVTNETSAKFVENGKVELRYDDAIKFETKSTGAKVTGALEVTQEYPTIRPTLDLNFAATKVLDDRITFTRDSVGTYVDENGILKYASNNAPRFDHDPTTGESLGLLIEESRTNLLNYSDLISGDSGGWWRNGGTTISKGSDVTAPDGTVSAWNTVYNGTSGDGNVVRQAGEVTTSNSTVYTLSVFAKIPSTNTYIQGVRIRTYNSNHSAQFNLSTGTISGTTEGTTTNRMEAYPNDWYRCSITFTSGTDGNQGIQFYLGNDTNTLLNDASANGEALYLWGAQLEQGSFPTSYIPTSGSTVTRSQDFAKITGTNFTDFYNQSEGTLVCDQSISDLTTANQYSVIFSSNVNESIGMGYRVGGGASGGYGFYIIKSGDALFRNVTGVVSADTPIRTALAYKLNDGATVVNGESAVNDTSLVLPTPDRMLIGEGYSANNELKKGHIRKLSYYNKRLPNAQLQGLTQQ